MEKKLVTVKIGGKLANSEQLLSEFAHDIKRLHADYWFIIIHGGGAEVSQRTKQLGLEPVFKDGIRITSPQEMDIVDEVLSGRVNTRLVRLFQKCGLNAVGLSCSSGMTAVGESLETGNGTETRTGRITEVDTALLKLLLEHDYVPVLSSTAMDKQGRGLNINADTAAFTIAAQLKCNSLLFFSDIPGVLKDNKVISTLNSRQARQEIADGTVSGGMLPKIRSALDALEHGVESLVIAQYEAKGSLAALIKGSGGTRIFKE
ncbi:MAG: acetylglutamate kinase [Spirochaetales bacterium]|nr:acetylglutamate kinase [Spirochaetales bacterium]